MTTTSVLRFSAKNGRAPEAGQAQSDTLFASSDPRSLAWQIALETTKQLIELQLVADNAVSELLAGYRKNLEDSTDSLSFISFGFASEPDLATMQKRLATQVSIPVWEISEKILPPAQFYKTHPRIVEACRQSGSVILDATGLTTITTASVNPLAGKSLAIWIRSELSSEVGEQRSPFCFHVAIPPHQWSSVARTRFGSEVQCLSK